MELYIVNHLKHRHALLICLTNMILTLLFNKCAILMEGGEGAALSNTTGRRGSGFCVFKQSCTESKISLNKLTKK